MSRLVNRRVVLAARPRGEPAPGDLRLEQAPVPEPGDGQVLLRTGLLSLDPYMRLRMDEGPSYAPSVGIGEAMAGATVAEVVASRHPGFREGELVLARAGGWQDYAALDGRGLRKLDPAEAPPSTALGVLGMAGLTAYAGLLAIGRPLPGETVVVAAAAGPVGSAVGQIARIKGTRAVGIAGGPEKVRALAEEFGFDAALDRRAPDLPERLRAACPDGVDVYFENVGGAVLRAVLPLLNDFARVPVCGLVAHYSQPGGSAEGPDALPALMRQVLVRRLLLRGFIVSDFVDQEPAFLHDMGAWVREGRVRYREQVVEGLERAPEALAGRCGARTSASCWCASGPTPWGDPLRASVPVAEPFAAPVPSVFLVRDVQHAAARLARRRGRGAAGRTAGTGGAPCRRGGTPPARGGRTARCRRSSWPPRAVRRRCCRGA
jgi:NADPH-dependent curcumin reductase